MQFFAKPSAFLAQVDGSRSSIGVPMSSQSTVRLWRIESRRQTL